jgi:cytochrome c-type biogenesis protein CcmE
MQSAVASRPVSLGRLKFLIGGLLIVAAIGYLIFSATSANSQYFLTVEELQSRGQALAGKNVRVSGAVIGNTIQYAPQSLTLMFSVAQVPGDNSVIDAQGGLAAVLHAAVIDPSKPRLKVVYHGPRPDLLKDEAQAIMTGQLGFDGVFQANELLLKCPTKYQEAVPNQVQK